MFRLARLGLRRGLVVERRMLSTEVSERSLPVRDLAIIQTMPRFENSFDTKKIKFETKVYLHVGRYMPVPEPHNMPEHKVKGYIFMDDLALDELGQARLAYMAGLRYNPNKRLLKITCEYFMNRIENRRWIIHTIEQLRRAAMEPDPEFDPFYLKEMEERERKRLKNKRPRPSSVQPDQKASLETNKEN